jgi:type IV secretion system protein VirB5
MPFKRSPKITRLPPPETPYSRAGAEWDARIGKATAQAANWRLTALLGLASNILLVCGCVYFADRQVIRGYVVEIDGQAQTKGIRDQGLLHEPTETQTCNFATGWVNKVRSKSIDPVIQTQNWQSAFRVVTGPAYIFLSEYAKKEDPFANMGKESKMVDILACRQRSDKSFEVRWKERRYQGVQLERFDNYSAQLTIVRSPPKEERDLWENPLSISFDGISWNRDL